MVLSDGQGVAATLRHYVACDEVAKNTKIPPILLAEPQNQPRETTMQENDQQYCDEDEGEGELASLLLGAGFALASLIILPAIAQRVGIGSSLTIALRGALMRAANRI
jgi:hypothetical protein